MNLSISNARWLPSTGRILLSLRFICIRLFLDPKFCFALRFLFVCVSLLHVCVLLLEPACGNRPTGKWKHKSGRSRRFSGVMMWTTGENMSGWTFSCRRIMCVVISPRSTHRNMHIVGEYQRLHICGIVGVSASCPKSLRLNDFRVGGLNPPNP